MNLFRILGVCLLLGGIGGGVYYSQQDTTVAVPSATILGQTIGGGRVNNIGLMNDKQNGLMMSVGAAVVGALLLGIGELTTKKK